VAILATCLNFLRKNILKSMPNVLQNSNRARRGKLQMIPLNSQYKRVSLASIIIPVTPLSITR
jgi:hypothetical protein